MKKRISVSWSAGCSRMDRPEVCLLLITRGDSVSGRMWEGREGLQTGFQAGGFRWSMHG